jgi:hypothetical protein
MDSRRTGAGRRSRTTGRARVRTRRLGASLERAPADADALHAFIAEALGAHLPRVPLLPGHAAPFDYVRHAFFEEGEVADCVVWANRGGGKTFLGAIATALDLVFKPGIEVRILGGSLEQSKRMHAHLRRLFERPGLAELLEGRITERRVRLRNGSAAEVLAQSQASVRGTRVQKVRCDEVELFSPDLWEAAQLATRSKRCGSRLVRGAVEALSTMHRPHGLMQRLVHEAGLGRRVLLRWGVLDVLGECDERHACRAGTGALRDCPLLEECGGRAKEREGGQAGHLDVDDAIAMKGRVSQATWDAEMLCLRPTRSDSVLPEFEPRVHVVGDLPAGCEGWTWAAGMDFGFRAPTVVLWGALSPAGAIFIADERVEACAVLEEHIRAIVEAPWPAPAWIGIDPSGRAVSGQTGLSDAQALARAGLSVRARSIGVHEGLSLVRARLRPAGGSEPRLFIHARCRRLIESIESYRYPADRPDSLEPVKDGSDHAVDALRYLVVNLDRPHRASVRWY